MNKIIPLQAQWTWTKSVGALYGMRTDKAASLIINRPLTPKILEMLYGWVIFIIKSFDLIGLLFCSQFSSKVCIDISINIINRRIYIANFAIFKIATFWSYHLHLRENSRSFSFTKLHNFLVGSAHVRSQATVHAFMHAAHAVCMRADDIDTRFKERA